MARKYVVTRPVLSKRQVFCLVETESDYEAIIVQDNSMIINFSFSCCFLGSNCYIIDDNKDNICDRRKTKMSGFTYVNVGKIKVEKNIYDFFSEKVVPEAELDVEQFWRDFEKIVLDFTPRNKELLEKRDELQNKIDAWIKENKENFDSEAYKKFLEEIGYLEKEVEDFEITVENVDDEIAKIAGPQLVVPINNARYAINAANARWGSLYDALYGSDIISEEGGAEKGDV